MEKTLSDKYLLVSDSNEVSEQWNSKKLSWDELVSIAQDALFKNHLDIMGDYLTKNVYANYVNQVEHKFSDVEKRYEGVRNKVWGGKFSVVDGQVILIKKDQLPDGKTPIEHLTEHWNITSQFSVIELHDCMLRGVTEITNGDNTMCASNQKVKLAEDNIPLHMHHSSITVGTNIVGMGGSNDDSDDTGEGSGNRYDMFYNDSETVGLNKNELQGVIEEFQPVETGTSSDEYYHNNMPIYDNYYAFLIRKNNSV